MIKLIGRELQMKNSWSIFTNDLNNIRKNIVTVIVLSGLIFLPSLYAWFNISASWDPYGQTDELPVGVVNEDEGTVIREEVVDVGDELVTTLKENDAMNWQFFNEAEAMTQLEKGKLFAVIIIPENFSKRLGSVVEKQPQKAEIEYFVNEKINAIAPKITEKGASVIVENINKQFIETVNGIIFSMFNEIGLELENELPDLRQIEQYVFDLEERLPDIHETLESSLEDANGAIELLTSAEDELPTVTDVVEQGIGTVAKTETFLTEAENRLQDIEETLEQGMGSVENGLSEMEDYLVNVKAEVIDFTDEISSIEDLQAAINDSAKSIENVKSTLEKLLTEAEALDLSEEQRESLEATIDQLANVESMLADGLEQSAKVITFIEASEKDVEQIFEQIEEVSTTVSAKLQKLEETFEQTIAPTVREEITSAKETLQEAHTILVNIEENMPEVSQLLQRTKTYLQDGEDLLTDVLAEYPFVLEKTTQLADKIRSVQEEADIHEIIELLKNDPEAEKGFLAEPVLLNENKVFPIENYGSGMTPFYTILSLWVGGLLLISLLATNVQEPEKYLPHEAYFGKLFLFLLIGCLQATIVTVGDIFILNVKMAHPVWFVMFGLFCSIIFMILIYTFVALFGNVGKAMVIIMLVLQIAGSGGTYPVALLPKFFQMISPFLPFTYAVGLMREAVGGIVWSNVAINIGVLALIGTIALVLGALLKRIINELAEKFLGESEDSGIFH